MRRIVLPLLLLCISLSGCVEYATVPSFMGNADFSDNAVGKWKNYGAVYEYDETKIIANFDTMSKQFESDVVFNQAIRVIDKTGVQYGTIELDHPRDGTLSAFDVRHVDSRGRQQHLDLEAMKEQYLETEKIVVPRVQSGSTIFVRVSFHSTEPLSHYDHTYTKKIPVLKSRFIFLSGFELDYDCRSYKTTVDAVAVSQNGYRGLMVEQKDVRPLRDLYEQRMEFLEDRLDYQDLPRTSVHLTKFSFPGYHWQAPGWSKIAESYRQHYHSTALLGNEDQLKKIAWDEAKYLFDDYKRADKILQYIQENISLQNSRDGSFRVDVDQVLEEKVGTPTEISVVYEEMLKSLGLKTNQYITRFPRYGGFDPEQPSWIQLQIPLIAVVIGDREYVAFPFREGFKLGEYPSELAGLYALNLGTGLPEHLPDPVNTTGGTHSLIELSLSDAVIHPWEYTLTEQYASRSQAYFSHSSSYDLKRISKRILQEYSDQHMLRDVILEPIERGDNVVLKMKYSNSNLTVHGDEGKIVTLQPFFRKYFTDNVATDQDAQFTNDMELHFEEEVHITDVPDGTTELIFNCEKLDNTLFRTECLNQRVGSDYVVSRRLVVKKAHLSQAEMLELQPEIHRLNRVSESKLIYRN